MELGQAGRRWNKKHFCSSPHPSPGRPLRQPRRASPSPARSVRGRARTPARRPALAVQPRPRGGGEVAPAHRRLAPRHPQSGPRGESTSADGTGWRAA